MQVHGTILNSKCYRQSSSLCFDSACYGIDMPKISVADHRRARLLEFAQQHYGGNKAALGRALKYADGAFVGQMLRGERPITEKTVAQIHALPGGRGWFEQTNVKPAAVGGNKIPLISYVQAGAWTEAVDSGSVEEWLLTDLSMSERAFALEIRGDSMLPEFNPGDRVIIDPDIAPGPGDFVVARNGHGEATFKKYTVRGINDHGQEVFELVPLNSDFPSMRSDAINILIIGTMVEHRKYRRGRAAATLSGYIKNLKGAPFHPADLEASSKKKGSH